LRATRIEGDRLQYYRMGVKEELEALRKKGVTSKNASKLSNAGGRALSTPESEENALKAEHERVRLANYGKDADANLKSYNEAKIVAQKKSGPTIPPTTAPIEGERAVSAAGKVDSTKEAVSAATTVNDDDDNDDIPTLEEVPEIEDVPSLAADGGTTDAVAAPAAAAPINRAERKARRMMEKLGMKSVSGISQVILKMRGGGVRGGVFTIASPDVFAKNGSYVVFGEARQGGSGAGAAGSTQAQQAQVMQQIAELTKAEGESSGGIEMSATGEGGSSGVTIEAVDDDAAVDESGVEAKDIELVVAQAGCSRSKAVKALKENDGDLVNAIMALTA